MVVHCFPATWLNRLMAELHESLQNIDDSLPVGGNSSPGSICNCLTLAAGQFNANSAAAVCLACLWWGFMFLQDQCMMHKSGLP